jgi:hypothetical protein
MGNATSTAADAAVSASTAAPALPRVWNFDPSAGVRQNLPLMGADGIRRLGAAQLGELTADDLRALDGPQLDALFDVADAALLKRFPLDVLSRVKPCLVEFRFDELSDEQRHDLYENKPSVCPHLPTADASRAGCLPEGLRVDRLADPRQLGAIVRNRAQLDGLLREAVSRHYQWFAAGSGCGARLFVQLAALPRCDRAREAYLELRLAPAGGGNGTVLPARALTGSQWLAMRVGSRHTARYGANVAAADRVGVLPSGGRTAVAVVSEGELAVPGTPAFIANGEQRRHLLSVFSSYEGKRTPEALYLRPKGMDDASWLKFVQAGTAGQDGVPGQGLRGTHLPQRVTDRVRQNWAHGPCDADAARFADQRHGYGADGVVKRIDDDNRPIYLNGQGPASPMSIVGLQGIGPFTKLLDMAGSARIAIVATDGVDDHELRRCARLVHRAVPRDPAIAGRLGATRLVIHLTASPNPMDRRGPGNYLPTENTIRIYGTGRPFFMSYLWKDIWALSVMHEVAHAVYQWLPPELAQRVRELPPVAIRDDQRDGYRHPFRKGGDDAEKIAAEDFAHYFAGWWRKGMWLPDVGPEALERAQPERAQLYRELFG